MVPRMLYLTSRSEVIHLDTMQLNQGRFPGNSDSKASAYNEGDPGSIPRSGRSPGEGNGNPL